MEWQEERLIGHILWLAHTGEPLVQPMAAGRFDEKVVILRE